MILNNIIKVLKDSKNIALMPHVSVDGDGLGTSLAFALALKNLGKQPVVYLEEDIPFTYGFLPGLSMVRKYDGCAEVYDAAVAIDTGDMDRLGDRAQIMRDARVTVNIDHHITNSEFAFYNYVDANAAAVGEIAYQMIKMMGLDLDAQISTCLYVAIATDTGSFKYGNTTAITHQITADLINNGVDVTEVSQKVFESTSLGKVRLMGAAINTLELLEKGKVAFITLTDEMIKNSQAKEEDCDGIVNIGRNINGVEVAAMLRPRDNGEIKVNLRSKAYVDVSAIAGMFGGGGHKRAAGCSVNMDIETLKKMLLNDIKEVLSYMTIKALNGVLNVLKPPGMTSFDVVAYLRRVLNIKKIGHTGTLDPGVAGVLPICLNTATKAIEYITDKDKLYRGELTLGVSTDTQDSTGQVTAASDVEVSSEEIVRTVQSFVGQYSQLPPMYSAVKVGGKKLYELARNGVTIERTPRNVTIHSIDIININENKKVLFDVYCSKGTYIRTLCADIGDRLGCGGHMSFLLRLKSGIFDISSALTLDEITERAKAGSLSDVLVSVDEVFGDMPYLELDATAGRKFLNGVAVRVRDCDCTPAVFAHTADAGTVEVIRVYSSSNGEKRFLGLGEIYQFDNNLLLKSKKIFWHGD